MNSKEQHRVFNDPVHGHIEIHPLCTSVMDTPQFQRLRYLKQLGACYYVFPGAAHNRFEHSLGVCYLAGELVERLRSVQPELNIDEKDVLCVKIAGLCHDLGHGPFSHMFDAKFIPKVRPDRITWKHEEASVKMFEYMVEDNNLIPEFRKYGLDESDLKFIREQIAGPRKNSEIKVWSYEGRDESKSFLYEIVANKLNGIDVDKWDYFARDCHQLGIRSNFDHNRFMKFARVLKVDKQYQICSRDKEVGNLYDMFYLRMVLHRRAYQHKTTVIIEHMILEALALANDHIKVTGKDGTLMRMSDAIDDMVAYTKFDDSIFLQILHSPVPELKAAQDILKKVQLRQHYRFIGQTRPGSEKTRQDSERQLPDSCDDWPAAICESMAEESQKEPVKLNKDDIVVLIANFDYGMKNMNPMDKARFYSKSSGTVAVQLRRHEVSEMIPEKFSEQVIRAYTKRTDEASIKAAFAVFQAVCRQYGLLPTQSGEPGGVGFTPVKTGDDKSSSSQEDSGPKVATKRKLELGDD